MALFGRGSPTLTASAQIVTEKDLEQQFLGPGKGVQQWQKMSWSYYDTLPEIRYPVNYKATSIGQFDYRIGVRPADDPTADAEIDGGGEWLGFCQDALASISGPFGDVSALGARYAASMALPGEGWLIGTDTAVETEWEFLSVEELSADNGKLYRNFYGDPTKPITDEINPNFIRRFWTPHPRWSYAPDSPMKALADSCERLKILNESFTSRLMSRLAQAGILFLPNSLVAPVSETPDGTGDAVRSSFAMKIMAQIQSKAINRSKAVIPITVQGPGEAGDQIKHITLDRLIDESEMRLREEERGTIATGMDLPQEVQQGMGDANHWSTWGIMDSTLRTHLQPVADAWANGLTRTVLWPLLVDAKADPIEMRRYVIVADPKDMVARPNIAEDGQQMRDRLAISDKAFRERSGAAESEAPEGDEYVRQVGIKMNQPYLAVYGLPEADEIDWSQVGTAAKDGTPGVGGTPPSRQPADPSDPAGAPGEGDAGRDN